MLASGVSRFHTSTSWISRLTSPCASPAAVKHRYKPDLTPRIPTTPCLMANTFIQPGGEVQREERVKHRTKTRILVTAGRRSHTWTQLTVVGGLVDAPHRAVGQNPEMEANPDAAVEQLLLGPSSDWMRRTCFTRRRRSVPAASC